MVLFTIIARVADGLPLAATMQDNEQVRSMPTVKRHLVLEHRTLPLRLSRRVDGSVPQIHAGEGSLESYLPSLKIVGANQKRVG